jgi:hypothetical protein
MSLLFPREVWFVHDSRHDNMQMPRQLDLLNLRGLCLNITLIVSEMLIDQNCWSDPRGTMRGMGVLREARDEEETAKRERALSEWTIKSSEKTR